MISVSQYLFSFAEACFQVVSHVLHFAVFLDWKCSQHPLRKVKFGSDEDTPSCVSRATGFVLVGQKLNNKNKTKQIMSSIRILKSTRSAEYST